MTLKTLFTSLIISVVGLTGAGFAQEHEHDPHHKHDDHDHPPTAAEEKTNEAATEAAVGEVVTVNVNGLVCDFCAQSIEKVLTRRDEVAGADVDLSEKLVIITMKPGATMSDEDIGKLIADAGYAVVSIDRTAA